MLRLRLYGKGLLLRLFAESVNNVCQEVGWQGVVVGFEATLRVHHEGAVGKLTKEVETVDHNRQVGLGEIAREAGIPHQIVGIAGGIGKAAVAIHLDIG